jgi:hypothetical protein
MSEFSIQLGRTDGFRYIGVQPPVDREISEQILEELGSEIEFEAVGNGRALSTNKPFVGPEHSELALTHHLDDIGDKRVHDIAGQIRTVLEHAGHSLTVDPELHYIGFGRHLFGGEDRTLG